MKRSIIFRVSFIMVLLFPAAAFGQVQAFRYTYVSALNGSDANNCSRTAPCRQISKALSSTQSSGTVTVLDTGEYANFTITNSVSVVTDKGAQAMIVSTNPSPNAGVYINDTSAPFATVTLRGLVIKENDNGIVVSGEVDALTIEDCLVQAPLYNISAGAPGAYTIRNTHVTYGNYGIWIGSSAGEVTATVTDSSFKFVGTLGLYAGDSAKVTVTDSIAEGNGDGFGVGNYGKLFLENCRSVDNTDDGVTASSYGWVRISNSTIVNNKGFGIRNSGGYARTFGNNRVANNSSGSTSGSVTLLEQQ
jgi:hypothetical protein